MNWLDIILVLFLIGWAFAGLKSGVIRMALSLVGIIAGIYLAGHYYLVLAEHVTFVSDRAAGILAFVIILLAVMILTGLLAWFLKTLVSAVMLGWLDHAVGAVFGLVMGALFISAILAIWTKYFGSVSAIQQSAIAVLLLDKFPAVLALLPEEFDAIRSFFE